MLVGRWEKRGGQTALVQQRRVWLLKQIAV